MYQPANITWTDLSVAVSGIPPSPRDGLGFTFAGGKIYVHGGFGSNGACSRINAILFNPSVHIITALGPEHANRSCSPAHSPCGRLAGRPACLRLRPNVLDGHLRPRIRRAAGAPRQPRPRRSERPALRLRRLRRSRCAPELVAGGAAARRRVGAGCNCARIRRPHARGSPHIVRGVCGSRSAEAAQVALPYWAGGGGSGSRLAAALRGEHASRAFPPACRRRVAGPRHQEARPADPSRPEGPSVPRSRPSRGPARQPLRAACCLRLLCKQRISSYKPCHRQPKPSSTVFGSVCRANDVDVNHIVHTYNIILCTQTTSVGYCYCFCAFIV